MGVPELDAATVGLRIERRAAAALLLAEGVARHRGRRHRVFAVVHVAEDGHDAPLRVGQHLTLSFGRVGILGHELLAGVEDDVEVSGRGRLHSLEPTLEHRELLGPAGDVAGDELRAVGVGDGRGSGARGGEVGNDEVNAERVVSRAERDGLRQLVQPRLHLLGGHAENLRAVEVRLEVAESERGETDETGWHEAPPGAEKTHRRPSQASWGERE